MSTTKQRISISPSAHTTSVLVRLAEQRGQAVASLSLALIERALELEEDVHFSRVADERVLCCEKRISHERAWRLPLRMKYRVEYLESVVVKDIPALSKTARGKIRSEIERKLEARYPSGRFWQAFAIQFERVPKAAGW